MRTPTFDPFTLRSVLEAAGWRCTPQRLAVYDHLRRADEHPTAEEVYQAVRSELPRISLATVYKSLEVLVDAGLAAKMSAGGAASDTSARYDARSDAHYHFRCLASGAVLDLPTPFDPDLINKLDPNLAEHLDRQGFEITGYRLEIMGREKAKLKPSGGPHS